MYVGGTNTGNFEQAREKSSSLYDTLTTGQEQDCEALIIYMFDVPSHTLTHGQIGEYVRDVLDIETDNWRRITIELVKERRILKMTKSDPSLSQGDTMTLNLSGLIEAAGAEDKPGYITPLLVAAAERLREAQKPPEQSIDIGLVALTQDTPVLAEPA